MLEFNSINMRTWAMLGQRGTLGVVLTEMAEHNPDLIVFSADLGRTSGLSRFMTKFPEQFINAGIAEQNMIGMAAGMANEGFLVFATSFANFIAMRSYEQVRLCLGYMQSPLKVVGIGSGYAMGMFGNSHYGIEDLSLMRSIPGLTVLSPADCAETVKCLLAMVEYDKPVYLRLTGGMNNPMVYRKDYDFTIGKAVSLDDYVGTDVTIFATGTMVSESIKAAKILREDALDVHVVDIHTISPLDVSCIQNACTSANMLVTVEEHSIVGGFGGAVAEAISDISNAPRLLRIGMAHQFVHPGEYKYLLEQSKLSAANIAQRIRDKI